MAQDINRTHAALSRLAADPTLPTLEVEKQSLAVISDLHMGDGGEADDLRDNVGAVLAALASYRARGFTVVLLGDIEELWQFDLDRIQRRYNDTVYAALREFGPGRVVRVFGNHDIEWRRPPDPAGTHSGATGSPEGVVVRCGPEPVHRILLVHGHQGSLDSDRYAWFSRFVVRGLFRPIEPLAKRLFLYGHPSATKSMVMKDYEHVMYRWAKANRTILVCGHSHRAIFASRSWAESLRDEIFATEAELQTTRGLEATLVSERRRRLEELHRNLEDEREKGRDIGELDSKSELLPCYFNTGCALYSDGMTALELENGAISLVKWSRQTSTARVLARAPLAEVRRAVCR